MQFRASKRVPDPIDSDTYQVYRDALMQAIALPQEEIGRFEPDPNEDVKTLKQGLDWTLKTASLPGTIRIDKTQNLLVYVPPKTWTPKLAVFRAVKQAKGLQMGQILTQTKLTRKQAAGVVRDLINDGIIEKTGSQKAPTYQ